VKEKFKDNILDMGAPLKPGGTVVTKAGATDGPFVEVKEIVGGYMIVTADDIERAIEVARESPGVMSPGSRRRGTGDAGRWQALERWTRNSETVQARPPRRAWSSISFPARIRPVVALLTRKVGVRHLDVVEDAVQGALLSRAHCWTAQAGPTIPARGCIVWPTTV